VVIVSTDGSATRIEQLMSKGVSAYVRKPFTPELLRKVITDVLGEWQDKNESISQNTGGDS
jgi:two-component system chemotaxis response regulator CheY